MRGVNKKMASLQEELNKMRIERDEFRDIAGLGGWRDGTRETINQPQPFHKFARKLGYAYRHLVRELVHNDENLFVRLLAAQL